MSWRHSLRPCCSRSKVSRLLNLNRCGGLPNACVGLASCRSNRCCGACPKSETCQGLVMNVVKCHSSAQSVHSCYGSCPRHMYHGLISTPRKEAPKKASIEHHMNGRISTILNHCMIVSKAEIQILDRILVSFKTSQVVFKSTSR